MSFGQTTADIQGSSNSNGAAINYSGSTLLTRTNAITFQDQVYDNNNTLNITSNPPACPLPAQSATLAPASGLAFGSQVVGTTSSAQSITLASNGTSALTITNITASGPFSQTNTCGTLPVPMPPGGTCTINVKFTPTTTVTQNGSLTITDNASGGTQTIQLTGSGITSGVTLSPSALIFNSQAAGTTSVPEIITLTNDGATNLTITNITASGPFSVSANLCPMSPATVAPKGDGTNVSVLRR